MLRMYLVVLAPLTPNPPFRQDVHPSRSIIRLPNSGLPWKQHIYDLEDSLNLANSPILFVTYQDGSGMWRVQAVPIRGTQFKNRIGIKEQWRGIRDEKLW